MTNLRTLRVKTTDVRDREIRELTAECARGGLRGRLLGAIAALAEVGASGQEEAAGDDGCGLSGRCGGHPVKISPHYFGD